MGDTDVQPPKISDGQDLPIKRISAHARREKSIRHGHISTLHIWWARRPLAACRAVICASLWPDPADENCPQDFRDAAARLITAFAEKVYNTNALHETASKESFGQWEGIVAAKSKGIELDPHDPAHLNKLRFALLDFIADFANWDNSTVREYLDTSRALTQAAHEALGGAPGTRPLIVDPFCGGGSIPLEALRVGRTPSPATSTPCPSCSIRSCSSTSPSMASASPMKSANGASGSSRGREGTGRVLSQRSRRRNAHRLSLGSDCSMRRTRVWPEVPLIRSLWLARKGNRSVALQLLPGQGPSVWISKS